MGSVDEPTSQSEVALLRVGCRTGQAGTSLQTVSALLRATKGQQAPCPRTRAGPVAMAARQAGNTGPAVLHPRVPRGTSQFLGVSFYAKDRSKGPGQAGVKEAVTLPADSASGR